ncbi:MULTISPECIES: hypothetical protein [unclassified Moorena]|uniref:hypothetical protein n=1 Tax=Moorena TaxID=1155738 RepID=UPI0013FE8E89|nr:MULTISPECIES: hypothetical protein [unclassified Moorena]NEO12156.1 hypothetical protein [Moorena sp. SIO3E8]NEQ00931.1 hypothetical protein [Moorena sp. SIO3F7]
MITISDLNVSRENCLTELKDAEMMGHIMGGFIKIGFSNILVGFGQNIALDLNDDGTLAPTEIYQPLTANFSVTADLGKLFDRVKPDHTSTEDCPEDW